MRRIVLVVFALIAVLNGIEAKSLKGQKFDFVCQDSAFRDAFVDVDEWRKTPVRHRYVHGGFRSNGTRFSFYFPEENDEFSYLLFVIPLGLTFGHPCRLAPAILQKLKRPRRFESELSSSETFYFS